jgi:hypothetical protein
MAFNISDFKNNGLQLGGSRPSLFEVNLTGIPQGLGIGNATLDKFNFTCRAANLPAATIASIDVGYFGRKIKIAGDRTFTDWTVTVMNDEDFLVRSMFEKWSNAINALQFNIRSTGAADSNYKAEMQVTQYAKTGRISREYAIIGAFPTSVDAIALDWDTTNQVETFNVTFAYDYWLPTFDNENQYLSNAGDLSPINY